MFSCGPPTVIHSVLVIFTSNSHFLYSSSASLPYIQGRRDLGLGLSGKQGDGISPKLFTTTLEEIFRQLHCTNKGLKTDGEYLNHLRFADDIVLIANNPEELLTQINGLNTASNKRKNSGKSRKFSNYQEITESSDNSALYENKYSRDSESGVLAE
ncbi:uncharacterized protein LOC115890750 [Sitophilus oryzae]|uniref:Uncharacterized protein LOC115890750 n=1 Tax=Sitophilus oryzae TaxID=7048 RepID=A0A6J2YUF8_SITOR|nr:uncharacterized protein LOC115890750 [Sitophilus oryzae]